MVAYEIFIRLQISAKLREKALDMAAQLMQAAPGDLDIVGGDLDIVGGDLDMGRRVAVGFGRRVEVGPHIGIWAVVRGRARVSHRLRRRQPFAGRSAGLPLAPSIATRR